MLNSNAVEYLVIGGYAVNFYGFSRATADLDIWIALGPANANRIVSVLKEFGFDAAPELFVSSGNIVRMGVPPIRLEILTSISGVDFEDCFARRVETEIDGVMVNLIDLEDLKKNKEASGRLKDRLDLENLA